MNHATTFSCIYSMRCDGWNSTDVDAPSKKRVEACPLRSEGDLSSSSSEARFFCSKRWYSGCAGHVSSQR